MEPFSDAVCHTPKWLKSSWKENSANFVLTAFSAPLCQAALLEGARESATRLL